MPDQLFFDIVKMVVALAFVVGLIYGVVYVLKRLLPSTSRAGGERMDLRVLAQLGMGSRQRVAVIQAQEKILVIGITEGSINTLAELTPAQPAAQKEADDPKIFDDLLSWRKAGAAPRDGAENGSSACKAGVRDDDTLSFKPLSQAGDGAGTDDRGEGPKLFSPGERPAR